MNPCAQRTRRSDRRASARCPLRRPTALVGCNPMLGSVLLLWIRRVCFEPGDVDQVLRTTRAELVDDQVPAREHCGLLISEVRDNPLRPRVGEVDAIDVGNDVHANGGDSNLEDDARGGEIRDGQVADRRPKLLESAHHALCVDRRRADPDIEILGCPNEAVRRESMCADDEKLNVVSVERSS